MMLGSNSDTGENVRDENWSCPSINDRLRSNVKPKSRLGRRRMLSGISVGSGVTDEGGGALLKDIVNTVPFWRDHRTQPSTTLHNNQPLWAATKPPSSSPDDNDDGLLHHSEDSEHFVTASLNPHIQPHPPQDNRDTTPTNPVNSGGIIPSVNSDGSSSSHEIDLFSLFGRPSQFKTPGKGVGVLCRDVKTLGGRAVPPPPPAQVQKQEMISLFMRPHTEGGLQSTPIKPPVEDVVPPSSEIDLFLMFGRHSTSKTPARGVVKTEPVICREMKTPCARGPPPLQPQKEDPVSVLFMRTYPLTSKTPVKQAVPLVEQGAERALESNIEHKVHRNGSPPPVSGLLSVSGRGTACCEDPPAPALFLRTPGRGVNYKVDHEAPGVSSTGSSQQQPLGLGFPVLDSGLGSRAPPPDPQESPATLLAPRDAPVTVDNSKCSTRRGGGPPPVGSGEPTHNYLYVNGKPYGALSLLGRGGSSEVYLVHNPETSDLLAVKCVNLKSVDPMVAEGYLNEVKLLSKLQGCTSVINMFDHEFIAETRMLYVVMEKGETDFSKLMRNIIKTKAISMSMIIYYWTEMLNAVKEIHDRGIIHSDLKPANFLLVEGRLKLIDFGIASSLQGDMTSITKTVIAGTYNYISPEAVRQPSENVKGGKISYKSDVWSLGCILYNMVYGRTPFGHVTKTWAKLEMIADPEHQVELPPTGREGRPVPAVLMKALTQSLVKDPALRSTTQQLLELQYDNIQQTSNHQTNSNTVRGEQGAQLENELINARKIISSISAENQQLKQSLKELSDKYESLLKVKSNVTSGTTELRRQQHRDNQNPPPVFRNDLDNILGKKDWERDQHEAEEGDDGESAGPSSSYWSSPGATQIHCAFPTPRSSLYPSGHR